jgi:hypothetical protein
MAASASSSFLLRLEKDGASVKIQAPSFPVLLFISTVLFALQQKILFISNS